MVVTAQLRLVMARLWLLTTGIRVVTARLRLVTARLRLVMMARLPLELTRIGLVMARLLVELELLAPGRTESDRTDPPTAEYLDARRLQSIAPRQAN